jgi:hypothetical protein
MILATQKMAAVIPTPFGSDEEAYVSKYWILFPFSGGICSVGLCPLGPTE